MLRLLIFALVVAAAWYGWKHQASLRVPEGHEVVVVNHSGRELERIRVSAGGQTVVVETLADGATVRQPLRARGDGPFKLVWSSNSKVGEREWKGGVLAQGPALLSHRFEFDNQERVTWTSKPKPEK